MLCSAVNPYRPIREILKFPAISCNRETDSDNHHPDTDTETET